MLLAILSLSLILFYYNSNQVKRNQRNDNVSVSNYVSYLGRAVIKVIKPLLLQSLTRHEIKGALLSNFLTFLVLILSLFLTSTYSSGLASIMTVPRYEAAINTVEDFANSQLPWGGTQDAWITSIQNTKEVS